MSDGTLTTAGRVRFGARARVLAAGMLLMTIGGIAALEGQQPPPQESGGERGRVPTSTPDASGPTEEQLKQLVVMLQVTLGGRTYNGAGVIVGRNADQLYILTARHVVREGMQEAESVRVRFRWLPGESRDAKILLDSDEPLDIAVLAVSGLASLSAPSFTWNALASPARMTPGQDVIPIGFPDGRAWFTPQLRSKVQEVTVQHVEFQGQLNAGNSGGALVTEDWSIVAIVSHIRPPTNRSSRIDSAIEKLKEWGYPVALTERSSGGAATTSAGSATTSRDRVGLPALTDSARWRWAYFPPPNAGSVLVTVMDDGNAACASYNASSCLWGIPIDDVDLTQVRPLACGEPHRSLYGVTGYDDPTHWCSLARQQR